MMKDKKKKITFPKGFFNIVRPHADKHESEDNVPFEWDEKVLSGKSKVKVVALKDDKE